ncbi:Beta-glucan synthesis-associated protein KRE6 [Fonsecaea pedrosoi]|nr:Beta-glucan synthesis-associated protein KRE6 [Fonsecaea pedrosoi]
MSSHSNSSSSSPPRVPPHIRLNSGQEDLLNADASSSSRTLVPTNSRPTTARSQLSNVYPSDQVQDSAERLLPPVTGRSNRFKDDGGSPLRSPVRSSYSSRRSSWESDRSRDSRGFENPFRDQSQSRPGSRAGSDDNDVNTQTVSEKYNILPSAGLLLFPEDVEKDDYLHNPDPNDKDRDCDIFNRRGLVNVGGLALITLGILVLFVGYPVLTFVEKITSSPNPCADGNSCIGSGKVPLLKNIRTSLIDPDTPDSVKTKKDYHGNTWNLVFSDEFSKPGRTFYEGDDPYWTAVDIWYGVTRDLEWYDPDAATTNDGVLELRFDAFQNHGLNYRSGMLQSWNQMCFKGGRLEASISLPGRGDTVGFWPGFWSMGNLGRPGYAATTDGLWPYSYADVCDAGITANQSSPDGISYLPGMRLPACTCSNEDHPTPGKSRSAPEIDVLEASVGTLDAEGNQIGMVSQSFQVAPFDIWYQPNYDFVEVFDFSVTAMNTYKGGPFQQAVSGLSNLNNAWYDGNAYQVYAYEYTTGNDGDITWFVGSEPVWRMEAQALGPNGNVAQRVIPEEPMSIIVNFGISPGFSSLNLTGLAPLMPATMRVDYIRIYQDDNGEMSCDPEGYETTEYINNHYEVYHNPNITTWADTGYGWPKNSLVNGC